MMWYVTRPDGDRIEESGHPQQFGAIANVFGISARGQNLAEAWESAQAEGYTVEHVEEPQ